jgi:hypothetical protein
MGITALEIAERDASIHRYYRFLFGVALVLEATGVLT